MTIYLIKSSLCLSAFLLIYYFVFEREKMHTFKRFYLLLSLVFSFLVPLFTYEFQAENSAVLLSNTLQKVVLPTLEINSQKNQYATILYSVYGVITSLLFCRFFWNLFSIHQSRRNATVINYENAKLALVNASILPYTFGSTIFVSKESYESQNIEAELFTHELTHVREKHTLDVLLIELLKTVFWFNPLLILYKRSIQLNHEFLADQKVIFSQNNVSIYQQLLLSNTVQPFNFCLTSNLTSFLKTKKRFIMMTKTTSLRTQLLKKAVVAPLFLTLFIVGSSITFAQNAPATKVDKKELKTNSVEEQKLYEEYLKKYEETKNGKAIQNSNDIVYNSAEIKPDFPGGIQAFYEFVGNNYKMPDVKDLKGKVYIKFIVEEDGSLNNFEIMRDIGHGTGEEAIRVLKLSPKWIPGEVEGNKVRTQFSLPISIQS